MASSIEAEMTSENVGPTTLRLNLNEPKWDQSTYMGRAKHFFTVTNPLNLFLTTTQLDEARSVVEAYKQGRLVNATESQLWQAKYRYDSAFHPDTKEKMFLIGRMSAQVPMNMSITGCMLTFYRTTPAVLFWQWFNQSFNAIVNYSNRSGDSPISNGQLGLSYALATTGAVTTAVGLNSVVKKAPMLVGRFVPFVAVAAANCINIPMMRKQELHNGIPVFDKEGNRLGDSKVAARTAITQVVFSRICMALPGMIIPPLIMNRLEKGPFLKRYPVMNAPIQVGLVGFMLVFATPMCCALFPQKSSISSDRLEPELQASIKQRGRSVDRVYFNKGL